MERLASDEPRRFQVEDGVNDFLDFAKAAERVEGGQRRHRFGRVHWRADHAGRYSIDADIAVGELDRQRSSDGVEASLGKRSHRRGDLFHWLPDEGRRDVDDVSAALRKHLMDGLLRYVEETG